MSRVPRKPRPIARSSELPSEVAIGRALVPKRLDPRQPDLFEVPFIQPCKPKLADKVPDSDRWLYEIKHDGYRAQCHVLDGRARIFTSNGRDCTACLPGIAGDMAALPVRSAVIDGEAVMLDENGVSDFFALHAAMTRSRAPDAILYAFDLLHLDGEDWRPRPLAERRARLAELLVHAGPALHLSEHHVGDGPALLKAACDMGLEGIVAKRRDAPYRSGYVDTWRKIKCTLTESFAVIGFGPEGRKGVASLSIARLQDGGLVPCGSVGSGISREASQSLREALDGGAHVVVDVEHRGATPAGELRHPVFKGWHGEPRP